MINKDGTIKNMAYKEKKDEHINNMVDDVIRKAIDELINKAYEDIFCEDDNQAKADQKKLQSNKVEEEDLEAVDDFERQKNKEEDTRSECV